jgi:hypothetical protein
VNQVAIRGQTANWPHCVLRQSSSFPRRSEVRDDAVEVQAAIGSSDLHPASSRRCRRAAALPVWVERAGGTTNRRSP